MNGWPLPTDCPGERAWLGPERHELLGGFDQSASDTARMPDSFDAVHDLNADCPTNRWLQAISHQ
jgi:hypothetical protein